MATLYLIRHTQSVSNEANNYKVVDTPLTTKGVEQAQATADELQNLVPYGTPLHILSSPSVRTLETAQIISQTLNTPFYVAPIFHEYNDGLSIEQPALGREAIAKRFAPNVRLPKSFPPVWNADPNESYDRFEARVNSALHWFDGAPDNRINILVSHGTFIKEFVRQVTGFPLSTQPIWNGSITGLHCNGVMNGVLFMTNSIDHLPEELRQTRLMKI